MLGLDSLQLRISHLATVICDIVFFYLHCLFSLFSLPVLVNERFDKMYSYIYEFKKLCVYVCLCSIFNSVAYIFLLFLFKYLDTNLKTEDVRDPDVGEFRGDAYSRCFSKFRSASKPFLISLHPSFIHQVSRLWA